MKYKEQRKAHAKHNEAVAKHLQSCIDENCNDWVVVTLFYASYHHALAALFPIEIRKDVKYETFQRMYQRENSSGIGRYEFATMLVADRLPEIASMFSHLKELSWKMRYQNHVVSDNDVKECVDFAEKIQAVCLPK